MTPRCDFCDIEMIDGQCPECFSILLTELWRRQDMAEMVRNAAERGQLTKSERDPLKQLEPKRDAA
jgi:hypothetical protein